MHIRVSLKKVSASLVAVVLAATALATVSHASPLAPEATATKVSFKFAEGTSAAYVMIIGPSGVVRQPITPGSVKTVPLGPTMQGKKEVRGGRMVPDGVFRVSLHLLDAEGKYIGPVNFKTVEKSGANNKWSTNVKPAPKSTLNLGTITQKSGGFATGSLVLATARHGRFTASAGATGKPVGAGTLGLTKLNSGVRSASLRDLAVTCDTFDQSLGGDCDVDGVVNAIDADDDNDGVLDLADKSTANFESQKFLPWSTLYLELGDTGARKTLNANISSMTVDDIEAAIGAEYSNFALAFYLQLPGEDMANYDAAWIDCGALSYCNSETGTAITGSPNGESTSVWNSFWCEGHINSGGGCEAPPLWRDYTGTVIGVSGETDHKVEGVGIFNGLTLMTNNGWPVWSGGIRPALPNDGDGVLDAMQFGDPYLLKVRNKNTGEIKSVPMSLGAYFITVPALASANGVAINYEEATPLGTKDNPIQIRNNGTFDLTFWRPQRQAVDGVDPSGPYMDLGGLRYGLIMATDSGDSNRPSALIGSRQGDEVGCSSKPSRNIYSGLTGLNATPDESTEHPEYDKNLWPLTNPDPDAAVDPTNVLSFTFNMKNCVNYLESRSVHEGWSNSATLDTSTTRLISIQLTAVGIDLTGGASRGAQTFWVQLPADTSGW